MSVRTIHDIAAVLLGCLSVYVTMIHLSTPALRGVRWVAIAYCSAAIGIVLRQDHRSNPAIVLGNLLITFLGIAFYWGLAQLLQKKRLNLWLLLFLAPVLLGAVPRTHLARVQSLLSVAQSSALLVTNNLLGAVTHWASAPVAMMCCAGGLAGCVVVALTRPTLRHLGGSEATPSDRSDS